MFGISSWNLSGGFFTLSIFYCGNESKSTILSNSISWKSHYKSFFHLILAKEMLQKKVFYLINYSSKLTISQIVNELFAKGVI